MNKTILITLCTLFFFATACKSQQETATETATETVKKGPKKPSAEDRAAKSEEMMNALNLSADQKVKFEAVEVKYGDKMKALRQSGDRDAMKDGMRALQEEKTAELKGFLSADQITKYTEIMKANRPQRGGGRR